MKKIGFVPNKSKDINLEVTKRLIDYVIEQDCIPLLDEKLLENVKDFEYLQKFAVNCKDMYDKADFLVSLGGDGTLLGLGRRTCSYNLPILGINLGTVGFLTTEEEHNGELAIKKVLDGDFKTENRILLDASIYKNDEFVEDFIALNDICLNRGVNSKMLEFRVFINGDYLCEFWADGIVVYTPTGSTAYNLSAGGPILKADGDMIGITPVSAHTLTSRPIVVSADDKITLEIDDRGGTSFAFSADGQENRSIDGICSIEIKKSPKIVPIIKTHYKSFYDILREKLSK